MTEESLQTKLQTNRAAQRGTGRHKPGLSEAIRPSNLPNCSSIIFLSLAGSFVRHGLKMRPLVRWRSSELFLPPSMPSAALVLAGLLDWRQGGDQLVVIFDHEINIARKCHGVGRRFQF